MKKFWKALGIAALAAAIPVRFKKDEESGKKTFQSLLGSVDVSTGEDGKVADIGINIGEGLLTDAISGLVGSKREAVHFADDDPEAAVVPGEIIDFTQAAAQAQTAAEEAQTDDSGAQDAADEQLDDKDVNEDDFDPEM